MTYSIPTLLEGKYYRSDSRGLEGIIQYASKRDDLWRSLGENEEGYTVQVRPTYFAGSPLVEDFYATVFVKVGE